MSDAREAPASPTLTQRIARLLPDHPPLRLSERLLAAGAAFVAILLLTAISAAFLAGGALPFMVASMGASAVLLFAVPHSPLAHPWSFAAGHLVAATVGVTCAMFIPNVYVAAALAVGGAIALMHIARCLHPPGGATALIPVIGGEAVRQAGFGFVVAPLGLNVLMLLLLALIVNNAIPGRRYPQRSAPRTAERSGPMERFGLTGADLGAALKEMNAYIDVTESDLEQIYARAEMHAHRRRLGAITCADIMTRDVFSAEYGDEIERVWAAMRERKVKGVPVVDRARRVVGIVTIVDFMKRVGPCEQGTLFDSLCRFIRRTPGMYAEKPEVVGDIMSRPAITARDEAHIVTLVPLFAAHSIHHVPIVDADNRLVGIVTQSDLMDALYRLRTALN
jgi:CBS domain-containing membrane protein